VKPTDTVARDMRRTALVVESDTASLASTVQVLRALDYEVVTALTFDDARHHILVMDGLCLLVADVRLGQFNGLHLAFRARAHHPEVGLVIIDQGFDVTLEAETRRLGGLYLSRPFTNDVLSALVLQLAHRPSTASGNGTTRRWARRQVAGIVATVGPREARVYDISYGGLCLEFPRGDFDPALPSTLDIELNELGLSLRMHPVWVRATTASPSWLCGGEVITTNPPSVEQWREFVDSH
jgi:DNA-binding response OmpR family regulator